MANSVINALESDILKVIDAIKAKVAEIESFGKTEVEKLEADLESLKARAVALYDRLKAAL